MSPHDDVDRSYSFVTRVKQFTRKLFERYVPDLRTIPLEQGLVWEPTWKTLPTHRWVAQFIKRKSVFTSLPYELVAFQFLMEQCHAMGEQMSQGILWPKWTRYAFDVNNKLIT